MSLRLGVNTWVWRSPLTDQDLAELAPRIARMGYTAVEMPLENPGDWTGDSARQTLVEHALEPVVIGAMGAGRSLIASAGDVSATQEYLGACIDAARAIGARIVAGPFYAPTGATWRMSHDERHRVVAELRENLSPLVERALAAGVRLAVEPLNRYETSVINTVEQGLEALDPLLGDGLGLALDTYHLNIEEKKPTDAIRAAGTNLAHVQVCGSDRGAVGDDHTDWPGFVQAVRDIGYDGVLGLESFTGENATIAVAASVWRPLAPSQDDLAQRSIDYLRSLGIDGAVGAESGL